MVIRYTAKDIVGTRSGIGFQNTLGKGRRISVIDLKRDFSGETGGWMSKTRASVSKVLGTKQPWSWVIGPVSNLLIPSGERKIDGCHWGINMIFFLSLTLGGQASLPPPPPSLHNLSQPRADRDGNRGPWN